MAGSNLSENTEKFSEGTIKQSEEEQDEQENIRSFVQSKLNLNKKDNELEVLQKKYPKILIADDQYFNIEAISIILDFSIGINKNIQIISAFNGQDALNKVIEDLNENE